MTLIGMYFALERSMGISLQIKYVNLVVKMGGIMQDNKLLIEPCLRLIHKRLLKR